MKTTVMVYGEQGQELASYGMDDERFDEMNTAQIINESLKNAAMHAQASVDDGATG
ncbi:hypothetical protein F0336_08690 [Serratia liquefaciens]|uniref:hypothetical protein n=1 Tax=Serratia liquefaciens TaxID=614 RepID=UPI0013C3AE77|nr:hypothetical protein [Serratia liquefaciens]QIC86502.1 hypothetical protein F0336_08690 [Serratia liquefaciens]